MSIAATDGRNRRSRACRCDRKRARRDSGRTEPGIPAVAADPEDVNILDGIREIVEPAPFELSGARARLTNSGAHWPGD
jgi:hypothetical protein